MLAPLRTAGRWFARSCQPVLLYLTLVLTWLISLLIFRVLNRTVVRGKPYHGPRGRVIVVSNHQSLIDSFLLGSVLSFPWILGKPQLTPYHLADARNFMTHPILRYVYAVLRVIPVGRSDDGERRDHHAFLTAKEVVRSGGNLFVFLEGTRSTDNTLLPPKPQVGALALDTEATVLPVYFTGMHDVHPYRKRPGDPPVTWWRRLLGTHTEWLLDIRCGHRIDVVIGQPISSADMSEVAGEGSHRRRATNAAIAMHSCLEVLRETVETNEEGAA